MKEFYFFDRTASWQTKFQKICRQLQRLMKKGCDVSSRRIQALIKRRNRYAKQLLLVPAHALKAGAVAGFSLLLAGNIQAQRCNTFLNADSANPIHRTGLPQNLVQPTFVDIDGDGDLDCYESTANQDDGGGSKLKITLLRNTGSKKVPYFEVSPGNGFVVTSTLYTPYNAEVDRTTFVDIDGDGDYDCFVGNYVTGGGAVYFKNNGTPFKPKFENTPSENPLAGIRGSYGFQVNFADLDADGDYDLTVSDLYKTRVFKNTGTKTSAKFESTFQSYSTIFSRVTLYDYDKDGLTDMLVGNEESNTNENYTRFYRNIGTPQNPKFKFSNEGPSFAAGFVGLYSFADLNNDGSDEAFAIRGNYATTAPVATIKLTTVSGQPDDPDKVLQAFPASSSFTYRWRKDGKIIPGETKPALTVSTSASYSVEITGSCGTGISLPYVYAGSSSLQDQTGVKFTKAISPATDVFLKVYPNPFAQQFTLYLGYTDVINTFIRISDAQGRIINTVKANSSIMQLGSNLQKGVYIVQVMRNDKVIFMQKIIKE